MEDVIEQQILDVEKDPIDRRDFKASEVLAEVGIPSKFCYASPAIKNQEGVGACVGFAAATLKEIQEWNENKENLKFSPFFIYWQRGWESKGMYCRQAVNILKEQGICYDATILRPYTYKESDTIPERAFGEAKNYKIDSYLRISELSELKKALYQYGPVLISMVINKSFHNMGKEAIVPPYSSEDPYMGCHAVSIIGYDNEKKLLKVQNSWGMGWGDQGCFYIPYDVFRNYVLDAWLAVDAKSDKISWKYFTYTLWEHFKVKVKKNKVGAFMGLIFGSFVGLNILFGKNKDIKTVETHE